MTTPVSEDSVLAGWNGANRRLRFDRRRGRDRRSLVRFESIGCDRRLGTPRRKAEMLWEKSWFDVSGHRTG